MRAANLAGRMPCQLRRVFLARGLVAATHSHVREELDVDRLRNGLSETAAHAATVAACLAARTGQPLHLVHALDLSPEEVRDHPGHPLNLWAEGRLGHEAERLRELGVDAQVHVFAGHTDKVVQTAVHAHAATLVVVGAIGHRGNESRRLGTRADRVARGSRVPVLTVRDSAGFSEWFKGERALRLVLGVGIGESADHAARWLNELCRESAVELVLAHLYWPPEAFARFGFKGIRSFAEPDAELVKTLERQFSQRFDHVLQAQLRTYRIEPHLGTIGHGLAALAAEVRADLLVVGSRNQSALERLWEGSITRQVLSAASTSVACVPAPANAPALQIPCLQHVLVATDFSEIGNDAIPLAFAAVSPGGTVHLLHVVKAARSRFDPYDVFQPATDEATSEAVIAAHARLSQLIPSNASAKHAAGEVLVLAADDVGQAICQAAERLGADLLVLGTNGRETLARAALGSVADHVLTNTRRPLLMARGPNP